MSPGAAVLIVGFAVLELTPRFEKLAFSPRFIPLGGVLSGFFGGLSGHQGALRTAFLIRAGLPKEAFIGTMVVSAVVDSGDRLFLCPRRWAPPWEMRGGPVGNAATLREDAEGVGEAGRPYSDGPAPAGVPPLQAMVR